MTDTLEPATRLHYRWNGGKLSLYAPWLATSRRKREIGFQLHIRDPRSQCEHNRTKWHGPDVTGDEWRPLCQDCGRWLQIRKSKGVHPRGRWRHVKVFAAITRPEDPRRRRGVIMFEAQTNLSDGLLGKITTKVFFRVKVGLGGRYA